jgi:hypothetical protein
MAERFVTATEGASKMRGLAIGIGVATILFLVTGGHLLLIPLLIPLGLFTLRGGRSYLAGLKARPAEVRNRLG